MTKLRFWIAVSVAWLLLFYNIERFHEPINIASFVYVYAAVIAMLLVAIRQLHRVQPALLLGAILIGLLALKWLRGYEVLGSSLALTITEACAMTITLLISWAIAQSISQFEQGAAEILSLSLPDFITSQVEFYQEVRRARQFRRPLSLLTIAPQGAATSIEINRFLEEIQHKTVTNYTNARLRDLIASNTKDCDIMAYCDDHFVVMLPEVNSQEATQVAQRLRSAARESLGLELQVGDAVFPEEEVTLSGMLVRAVSRMRGRPLSDGMGGGLESALEVDPRMVSHQLQFDLSDVGQTDDDYQA